MSALLGLIARVEKATEGSPTLDEDICDALGLSRDYDAEGNFGAYKILPTYRRFSRSLDAKLPGEDIIIVSEQKQKPGDPVKWMAVQRYPYGIYGEAVFAHTEVLARRLAALKAILKATEAQSMGRQS